MCGAEIEEPEPAEAGGANLSLYPMISFSPKFATCFSVIFISNLGTSKKS
jgi:hypothetical protein